MPKETVTTDERQFSHDTKEQPYVFIQWKGTDACLDFHYKCGAFHHFDGYFAYVLKCVNCGTLWRMPFYLFPKEIDKPDSGDCVQELSDEDA
jgi:hypothetical protein